MSDDDVLRVIEHMIRDTDTLVRSLWPNFNSHRNAERIIQCLNRANEDSKTNPKRKYENRDQVLG